jgi:AhpD family alkylhydroperoxidase
MRSRLKFSKTSPQVARDMLGLEACIAGGSIERPLIELVGMRASQINGCAYCLDMHSKDACAGGESEQRLYTLDAWRETPFFTARERAVLAWTETLTRVADTHVPDVEYEAARVEFSEQELVDLTLVIVTINAWNRIAVGFRSVPGTYQPARLAGLRKSVGH